MLIGFSVGNFRSFKETQSFSMFAGRVSRHNDHVVICDGKRILKSSLIYGANAGGKSNFVKAFDFSRRLIISGMDNVNLNKKYFRISGDMYEKPGYFEYDIIAGGHEYLYGLAISYSEKVIVGEWLIRKEDGDREVYLFNREYGKDGSSVSAMYDSIQNEKERSIFEMLLDGFGKNISDTFKKKTILSDIAVRYNTGDGVISEIKNVYDWIRNMLIIYPDSVCNDLGDMNSEEGTRCRFESLLRGFDTGIERVISESRIMDFDTFQKEGMSSDMVHDLKVRLSNMTDDQTVTVILKDELIKLHKSPDGNILYNKMLMDHGNPDDPFDYEDESDGTKRLFDLLPIFQTEEGPSVVIIDEIDRSLHSNLIRCYLETFFRLTAGTTAQLIASTHDSNLLDLSLMRQDEYWFVERGDDHSSRMYSLNRFKERYDKKIDKEYLIGRYGAVPVFRIEEMC